MRRRKKFVFRDEEEKDKSQRVLRNPLYPQYEWNDDWYGDWDSLFPTQQEVLSGVEKAISAAEKDNVGH